MKSTIRPTTFKDVKQTFTSNILKSTYGVDKLSTLKQMSAKDTISWIAGNGTTKKTKLLSKSSRTGFGLVGSDALWRPDKILSNKLEIVNSKFSDYEKEFEALINGANERWPNKDSNNKASEGSQWVESERTTPQFPYGNHPTIFRKRKHKSKSSQSRTTTTR